MRWKRRKNPRQGSLRLLRGRGGPGRGQGRKKGTRGLVSHRRRPFIDGKRPLHISTKIVRGLPSLRGRTLWAAVRRAFAFGRQYHDGSNRVRFRIVHFSVQGRHIHLICEADSRKWLSRGIQGFKIRVGKQVNKALGGRKGSVFADRYHERLIKNPTQCRHALAYVLNNSRHHAYEERATYPRNRVDPCSSAMAFDGWSRPPRPWGQAPPTDVDDQPTSAEPGTWLLRGGWRRAGPKTISANHIPGLPRNAPALPQW